MKIHKSVVDKILRLFSLYGGRQDDTRLVQELSKIDLTAYNQKSNPNADSFLVLTEEIQQYVKDQSKRR